MRRLFAVAWMLPATALAGSAIAPLRYEPAEVTLTGVVQLQTFPGRPNYEDVSKGDEPEVYWILHLSCAVDVVGANGDDINVSEGDVREIQLVLSPEEYTKYGALAGERVVVTGSLFHSITAHHKTAVLLRVRDMKKSPDQQPPKATSGQHSAEAPSRTPGTPQR